MARIAVMATYGPENVGRANAASQIAAAAVDEGHQVAIILELDGTLLVKDSIIQNIHGLGLTPLRDLYPKLVQAGVPIYVSVVRTSWTSQALRLTPSGRQDIVDTRLRGVMPPPVSQDVWAQHGSIRRSLNIAECTRFQKIACLEQPGPRIVLM